LNIVGFEENFEGHVGIQQNSVAVRLKGIIGFRDSADSYSPVSLSAMASTQSHQLLISDAKGNRKVLLDGLKYTIGRDVTNNIQLHSRFVSRQHAVLLRVPASAPGRYLYRIIDGDLSGKPSVNGVIVNYQNRVSSYDLCHGDILTLAPNVQLTYLIELERD